MLVTAALALTGCTASPEAEATSPGPSASSTEAGLSFAAGASLDPSWRAQWADPFTALPGFSIAQADAGDGSWAYRQDATGCVLGYWQGAVQGLDPAGGDRDASDQLLALQFDGDVADVADFIGDDVAFDSFTGPVQARSVAGADDQAAVTYIVAARAFATLGSGLVATLRCPASIDVYAQWRSLAADPGAFIAVVGPLG